MGITQKASYHIHTPQIVLLLQLILIQDERVKKTALFDCFETNMKHYTEAAEERGGQ